MDACCDPVFVVGHLVEDAQLFDGCSYDDGALVMTFLVQVLVNYPKIIVDTNLFHHRFVLFKTFDIGLGSIRRSAAGFGVFMGFCKYIGKIGRCVLLRVD